MRCGPFWESGPRGGVHMPGREGRFAVWNSMVELHGPHHTQSTHSPHTVRTQSTHHPLSKPQYLERLLAKAGGDWFVGAAPTAADLAVYEVTDLHRRPQLFPEEMKAQVWGERGGAGLGARRRGASRGGQLLGLLRREVGGLLRGVLGRAGRQGAS